MKKLAAYTILAALAVAGPLVAQDLNTSLNQDLAPNGKGGGVLGSAPNAAALQVPIRYHGGPVMLGTVNVYYIWYGNWAGNTATAILTDLANSLGRSPYFNINAGYFQRQGLFTKKLVTGAVHYVSSYNDSYSQGKALTDDAVQAVVNSAITNGHLPKDTSGVYFVLTSKDVLETSGFCSQYCGWHFFGTIAGSDIKYAFVGNPDQCPLSCEEQTAVSPNGNPGADGMASIIAHELEESTTDPDLDAWYDALGNENADKCAWTFGITYNPGNGSRANVKLGVRNFLIQRNWVNSGGGFCALKP